MLAGWHYWKYFQAIKTLKGPLVSLTKITLNQAVLSVWANVNLFWDFYKCWVVENLLPLVDIT